MKSSEKILLVSVLLVGILGLYHKGPVEVAQTFRKTNETAIAMSPKNKIELGEPKKTVDVANAKSFQDLKQKIHEMTPDKADPIWREKFSRAAEFGPPPEIMALGRIFGRLNLLLEKAPELRAEVMQLYSECATREGNYETVKVTCLANYRRLAPASKANELDRAVSTIVLDSSLALGNP